MYIFAPSRLPQPKRVASDDGSSCGKTARPRRGGRRRRCAMLRNRSIHIDKDTDIDMHTYIYIHTYKPTPTRIHTHPHTHTHTYRCRLIPPLV